MKRVLTILAMQLLLLNLKAQSIITTIAGNGTAGYSGDGGQAINAELLSPTHVLADAANNLYIVDAGNNCIRKVNTSGIISTIAGSGMAGYSGDGGQATAAKLSEPQDIAFSKTGNLYITDGANYVIRMVNTQGIISTVVGNGTLGYGGDGGEATNATLGGCIGIVFDTLGNLYFSDFGNNVIRKVNSAGIISTVMGNGTQGYSGDGGQATAATLYAPYDLAFDKGNLYIADGGNNVIRKVITSTGIISTVAGNSTQGYSGDGGQATSAALSYPDCITLDYLGNLYISDGGNDVIRKVNTSTGIINTIAGTGTLGFSGDGGSPLLAQFNISAGIAFDTNNNLYVADDNVNQRVRKITNASTIGIEQYAINNVEGIVYPNPASNNIQVTFTGSIINITVFDMLGKEVLSAKQKDIDVSSLSEGVYFVKVETNNGIITKKVVVQR